MLTPVTREKSLTERAAEQLERVILQGGFRPGDRLPPERKLAEMIGVSRTVVREAVRLLSSKRLIDVRTGSGIFVNTPGVEVVSEPLILLLQTGSLTAQEVHEVRAELEVRIAGLAAERADNKDLDTVEQTIHTLSRRGLSPIEYAESDAKFHIALAEATHNRLFPVFLQSLNACLVRSRIEAFSDPHTRARALEFHIEIMGHVRARDIQLARAAMERHLLIARRECYKALPPD